MIATGNAWTATGDRNAFLWDGSRFTSIGGGIAAIAVDAVAITRDGLFFGGPIAEVGPANNRIPSVGTARMEWPDR